MMNFMKKVWLPIVILTILVGLIIFLASSEYGPAIIIIVIAIVLAVAMNPDTCSGIKRNISLWWVCLGIKQDYEAEKKKNNTNTTK